VRPDIPALTDEIRALAAERDSVVLAHNYQRAEVQDAADIVGDSLALARQAAATDASVIVLAGVHFMAETAAILSPEKRVFLPRTDAGCPMADMVTSEGVEAWRENNPGVPVVTYVNSSAAVKAVSDVCVTSANAVAVVRSLGAERILFTPDRNLGSWVARSLPEVAVELWPGYCPIHDEVTTEQLLAAKAEHPGAEVLAHPECRPEVVDLADSVLSTSQMLRRAAESPADEFIVVTEGGLLHGLSKAAPGKRFFEVAPRMLCPNMKMTSLTDVRDCLRDGTGRVTVPEGIRLRALQAVERMVAID
jgi:quinolinate synthase